jgi:hypothetical protein
MKKLLSIASLVLLSLSLALPTMATTTAIVEDEDGNTVMVDDEGNAAVIDKEGNTYLEDSQGNIAIIDSEGNTYVEDSQGNSIILVDR